MLKRIIIAGAGGQGIMLLGKVLAEAVMREDRHVTWLPAYGAEVRGGTAHCMVVISGAQIGSPYIEKADALIAMNEPSLIKFQDMINASGTVIVNSSLVDVEINHSNSIKHPFTDIALGLGNIKVANMVALGCFIAKCRLVAPQSVFEVIEDIAPPDKRQLVEINKRALQRGMDLIR